MLGTNHLCPLLAFTYCSSQCYLVLQILTIYPNGFESACLCQVNHQSEDNIIIPVSISLVLCLYIIIQT